MSTTRLAREIVVSAIPTTRQTKSVVSVVVIAKRRKNAGRIVTTAVIATATVPIAPVPNTVAAARTTTRCQTQIPVAITAYGLSRISEKQIEKTVAAGTTPARIASARTVAESRITYIAHSISIPLVYLRRNLIL